MLLFVPFSGHFRYIFGKSTKKFKNIKNFGEKSDILLFDFFVVPLHRHPIMGGKTQKFYTMAKIIEFIAPVEAIRGNLSGAQKLLYAQNDNPAYDGPVGFKNYARNYTPRFIGAKRASDGRKYFVVRTKTANHLTAKAKHAMALMGGAGAIVGAILAAKSSAVYTGLLAQWAAIQEMGDTRSFRKFLTDYIMRMLAAKSASITITGPKPSVTIKNPWAGQGQTTGAAVSNTILVKFWTELASNGIVFHVSGMTGVAFAGGSFDEVCASQYNVLGLTGLNSGVQLNGTPLYYDGTEVSDGDVVVSGGEYTLGA